MMKARLSARARLETPGQADNARQLLTELATEFPGNALFSRELELLNKKPYPPG